MQSFVVHDNFIGQNLPCKLLFYREMLFKIISRNCRTDDGRLPYVRETSFLFCHWAVKLSLRDICLRFKVKRSRVSIEIYDTT